MDDAIRGSEIAEFETAWPQAPHPDRWINI
jgi:hypothetical protein